MSEHKRRNQESVAAEDIDDLLSTNMGKPPSDIDALVRQRAREATRDAPRSVNTDAHERSWARYLPVAAVLLVTVGVTLQLQRPERVAEAPLDVVADVAEVEDSAVVAAAPAEPIVLAEQAGKRSRQAVVARELASSAAVSMDARQGGAASPDALLEARVMKVLSSLQDDEAEQAVALARELREAYPGVDLIELIPVDTEDELRAAFEQLMTDLE